MITNTYLLQSLCNELSDAPLGDRRLSKRLEAFGEKVGARPAEGFPQVLKTESDLEGWYRLLRNERVNKDNILVPHIKATVDRVIGMKTCLVLHDTSLFCFRGNERREGLFKVAREKQGFLGHFALAVGCGEEDIPLGVLGLHTFTRKDKGSGKKAKKEALKYPGDLGEKRRWFELVEEVEKRLDGKATAIHVMDREADCYAILADLIKSNRRFVIRIGHDRVLSSEEAFEKLYDKLEKAPEFAVREVELSPRKESRFLSKRKSFPARPARKATLSLSASEVVVAMPSNLKNKGFDAELKLHVVLVKEKNCPKNETPIEWMLVTRESIGTPEEVSSIVDIYTKRWTIEEYFKALKTGCALEKRQLESRKTLENALAALVPVAWRLLLLRSISRNSPDDSASRVLTKEQITILQNYPKIKLAKKPTTKEALQAVAKLGGHLKSNGPPGWLIFGRGFDALLWLEVGWKMAVEKASQSCDQ